MTSVLRTTGRPEWKYLSCLALVFALGALPAPAAGAAAAERLIRFNREIRPILSETCFSCHGPDRNARKAKLRLDSPEDAYAEHKGGKPLVPGQPEESEVIKRITSSDPEEQMPPKKSGKHLTQEQVKLLRTWVAQGAHYEGHWSFIPPVRNASPGLEGEPSASVNPVDAFIRERLRQEGLAPSPEADRRALLRRLSFDLTGLPPRSEEVRAFLADRAPLAYERLVERYLRSPHFGERLAAHWLDLVRYGDTVGYHGDCDYSVWPYRDYVINAFNRNLPFDQFTREQLAGDLLPQATAEQQVASGYNRLLRISTEGGVQDKEYLAKYAADRVRTTSTIWMGATLGCAECHDHKFDPYSTKDFYRFAAFFADLEEKGFYNKGFSENDWGPKLALPGAAQKKQLDAFDKRMAVLATNRAAITDAMLARSRERWEERVISLDKSERLAWTNLTPIAARSSAGSTMEIKSDQSVLVSGPVAEMDDYTVTVPAPLERISGVRLEVLKDSSLPGNELGRSGQSFVLAEVEIAARTGSKARARPVQLAGVEADFSYEGFPARATIDGRRDTAWSQGPGPARDRRAAFVFAEPIRGGSNVSLIVRLKHSRDYPREQIGKFRLAIAALERPGIEKMCVPENVLKALRIPAAARSNEQTKVIAQYYRGVAPELEKINGAIALANAERELLIGRIPTMLVSQTTEPRTMRVLPRGNWMNDSGDVVEPGAPQFLGHLEAGSGRATRLDLANWFVSTNNPLTARVFVNRVWKLLFGAGLSKTLDDLGAQGEWPTHPELLDWLACEFMQPTWLSAGEAAGLSSDGKRAAGTTRRQAWDVRHLLRVLVTSRTYRQSSLSNPTLEERDPLNRLLARQSPLRLDAEMVRDNALAIAGLLVDKQGGASVRPYQPEGYYAALNFPRREYVPSGGTDLYRRSLYTHWQRTFLHPSLAAFDAVPREECTVNRANSNTPLQALVLLNDPIHVEAARVFAEQILRHAGRRPEKRFRWAFERTLARPPSAAEMARLSALLQDQQRYYQNDPAAAGKAIAVGQAPVATDLNAPELAAWTAVCRVMLNLHETITRN